MPAQLIDGVVQTLLALAFPLKFFPVRQTPQMLNQQSPVDQKCPACLVAAEAVQQLDRPPAPQSNRRSMMARSTTGTSNVSSSATISGICNNHRALAGIGTVSPA